MASRAYSSQHGKVHFQKRGMGDPLVLVHNIYPGASHEEYNYNINELARQNTVYALDLLGFGRSAAPRLKYTAKTYVDLLADFVREVVPRPTSVVASGLSCSYVTEVAAYQPDLFDKITLICPRSEPTGLDVPRWLAPFQHFMISNRALAPGHYDAATGDQELEKFLLTCFHNPKHVRSDLIDRLYKNAGRKGAVFPYASLITGYLDCRLLDSLPKVKNPILLLWGRQARPTPVEHSVRLIAMAQRSRLEVVENAGAWVHHEQSAAVNKLILRFLSGELQTMPPAVPAAAVAAAVVAKPRADYVSTEVV